MRALNVVEEEEEEEKKREKSEEEEVRCLQQFYLLFLHLDNM